MENPIFVLGDGDAIRNKVESYLLKGELERLGEFSLALTEAIFEIKESAISTMGASIVFAGGDDILFMVNSNEYHEEKIKALMEKFSKRTSCSISFGAGANIESAYINLRKAKACGKGILVSFSTA